MNSDMIAIDAVFTPVLRVRYKVENTRVGQDTNLQQLTITVDTDGTVTPKEAFEEAAAILVNQFTALAGGKSVESSPAPGSNEDEEDAGLMRPIEELELSARTANALLNNDIGFTNGTFLEQEARAAEILNENCCYAEYFTSRGEELVSEMYYQLGNVHQSTSDVEILSKIERQIKRIKRNNLFAAIFRWKKEYYKLKNRRHMKMIEELLRYR